ncbi:MAG: flavin reductase [Alphaproteobacteria bacterium]|nr:flavin reductase [Alphaproteobacteria bacterium]
MTTMEREFTLEREAFVAAMRRAATGVTVVATDGAGGRHGCTVSAMSSVSADPPTLLVCVHQKSPVARAIATNRVFSVRLLGADHRQVSEVFAGRVRTEIGSKFACGLWGRLQTGAPVLADAPAAFDCQVADTVVAGSHLVVIGRVVATRSDAAAEAPLVYANQSYRALGTAC